MRLNDYILILAVLTTYNCSSNREPDVDIRYGGSDSDVVIDEELRPYVGAYLSLMDDANITPDCPLTVPSIGFGDVTRGEENSTTVGLCTIHSLVGFEIWGEVLVRREYWDMMSDVVRRWLIYHELTHCYYQMDHVDNPDAIMYYTIHGTDDAMESRWNRELIRLVGDIRDVCNGINSSSDSLNMSNTSSREPQWPGLEWSRYTEYSESD
jgi:hypothetical protein